MKRRKRQQNNQRDNVAEAREKHVEFYNYSTEYMEYSFPDYLRVWPKMQGLAGNGTKIGYFSDKFDEEWREYNHKFSSRIRPVVVRKKQVMDKPFVSKKLFMPNPPIFVWLGFALDLEFNRGKGPENFDWKGEKDLPFLGWHNQRKILVIQPQSGSSPILVHSRILKVTDRGIEN